MAKAGVSLIAKQRDLAMEIIRKFIQQVLLSC